MGYQNIGPVYRVSRVEIEHSSKTSLFQETKGETRESGILDPLWYCVFTLPWTHWVHSAPRPPAELNNKYLTQMRIGGQRTAFEIHHCTKCKVL